MFTLTTTITKLRNQDTEVKHRDQRKNTQPYLKELQINISADNVD